MKFFHLADLHIGCKLYNRDLLADQTYVLGQVVAAAEACQPDAVVIAGDIYDKSVPTAEAVEVFDTFLTRLAGALPHAAVMMIAGNHDSASRINLYRELLKGRQIYTIGKPPLCEEETIEKVTLTDEYGPVNFYLLPFVKPSLVKEIVGTDENGNNFSYDESLRRLLAREKVDERQRNVLVSHQFYVPEGVDAASVTRMDSELPTVGNIDAVRADVLRAFDYAALGHIHKPMAVGGEAFRYAGTPLPCSVSEAGQKKGIIEVKMGRKGEVETRVIPLKPLHEAAVISGTLEEVLKAACDDYVSVTLTDKTDLDVFDMQDKLRAAFPNLLEIRREGMAGAVQTEAGLDWQAMPDPFTLCCLFLNGADEEEKEILKDVINSVQEEAET